jgi:hypothetical protein
MTYAEKLVIYCHANGCNRARIVGARTVSAVRHEASDDGWACSEHCDYCPDHAHSAP